MADFTERMRLRGKAAEDIYFAEQERKLIAALHEKQGKQLNPEAKQISDIGQADNAAQANNDDVNN